MTTFFFLDSHGGLWASESPDHPEAEAFGPGGAARPLRGSVAGGLDTEDFMATPEGWLVFNAVQFNWTGDILHIVDAQRVGNGAHGRIVVDGNSVWVPRRALVADPNGWLVSQWGDRWALTPEAEEEFGVWL